MKTTRINWLGIAIIALFALFAIFVAKAEAQDKTFIGGGVSIIRSSNFDPTPAKTHDGGSTFPGGYVEGALALPKNFQARVLAEYSGTPQLQTIFTTDEGSRKAIGEFRIRPELRYYFNPESKIRPFVAGGADFFHQRFAEQKPAPLPEPVPAIAYEEEHGHSEPSSGFNAYLTFGAAIGEYHEASFTRLFTDHTDLNPSKLSGYRGNYTYTRPLFGPVNLKAGVELDWLKFRETNGYGYVDPYYETDTVIKARIGFVFGGGKR